MRLNGQTHLNYMGTSLSYKFNTCKIAGQDDVYLMQHPNPFALIILIAKATALKALCRNSYEYDDRLLAYKLRIARLICDMKLPGQKERIIMNFLFHYINF